MHFRYTEHQTHCRIIHSLRGIYFCENILGILFVESATDHHPSDLASSSSDLVQFRVSEQTSSSDLVDVAVSAHKLDSIQGTFCRTLGSVENCASAVLCPDHKRTRCSGTVVYFTCGGVRVCSRGS